MDHAPHGGPLRPDNTFWELFHAAPASSAWSLVTPPGVADNGGLVESASADADPGRCPPERPAALLPLAQSAHSGSSWAPAFLPGALAPVPDALAYDSSSPGAPSPCWAGAVH